MISIATPDDPADGIQKIVGNVHGLRGFVWQKILDLSKPVTCFDQDALESGPMSQFDVGAHVSDDKGSLEIDFKGFACLFDETGLGFSAIAVMGESRNRPCWVMGTEKDPVNVSLLFSHPRDHEVVKSLHKIQGVIAPGHSGLIGDHKHEKPVTVEHPYGLRHPGKNSEPAHVVDVTHLLIDGPIPIDEDCRFSHPSFISQAARCDKSQDLNHKYRTSRIKNPVGIPLRM